MRKARVDGNHREIVTALRQVGASVESLARVGDDVPDLLVGFRGKNYVFEVKTEKGALSEGQAQWQRDWGGETVVIRSVDEALTRIGAKVAIVVSQPTKPARDQFEHVPNPEMFKLARESRGLTVAALSRMASIPRKRINSIEGFPTFTEPTNQEIAALSAALQYPEGFFFQTDTVYGPGLSAFCYERRKRTRT